MFFMGVTVPPTLILTFLATFNVEQPDKTEVGEGMQVFRELGILIATFAMICYLVIVSAIEGDPLYAIAGGLILIICVPIMVLVYLVTGGREVVSEDSSEDENKKK